MVSLESHGWGTPLSITTCEHDYVRPISIKEFPLRPLVITAALLASPTATFQVTAVHAAQPVPAAQWEIGPIIRRRNYSVGMPLHPAEGPRGPYFDFPYPSAEAGHVHYVTFRHGPLSGKSRIVMRYRIDTAPGVRFVPRENPNAQAILSLYFQRTGDSWVTRRGHEAYRWYAPNNRTVSLTHGEHTVSISLREDWMAVMSSTARTNPRGFQDALHNADRVGFVLGDAIMGRGHGVYATGPARFTLLGFQVL